MLRSMPQPMTFNEYIKDQSYYEQLWTGASITVLFFIGIAFYYYCWADQSLDRLMDKAELFVLRLFARRPTIKEGFEDYVGDGAETVPLNGAAIPRPVEVRIGLDLDDPESPKEKFVLGPTVWHPRRLMPIRRHIGRTTSAPVFTVPLSPSDEPKKVWH